MVKEREIGFSTEFHTQGPRVVIVNAGRLIREEHKKSIVKSAVMSGDFDRLTKKQQDILKVRGYLGRKPLVPFRELEKASNALGITFQSAYDREVRALRRLENGGVRLRMKPDEREFILKNPRLPAKTIAERLGNHERGTIGKWKDELGLPRNPTGRPRKSGVSS